MSKGTKRANGDGTIRKRTVTRNGRTYTFWEGTITTGIDIGTGKQQRRTFTGKSQKEVSEKMRAASTEVDKGTYFSDASKLTLKQWFEIWLSEYMGDKKPLTVMQYKSMATNHIYNFIGAVKLSKLTSPQIQKFYNELGKTGKTVTTKDPKTGAVTVTHEPLSAKTIRNIHGIMSKCLNVAVDQGLLKSNPAERVTVPKVIKKEIQPLTEEQQKAFLQVIQNHKYKNLYSVILFTGLRESEAIGLTWDCIDFQKGTLKVYRQLQKRPGAYVFAPLKNSKTRSLTLSPYVLSILKQQRRQQTEDRLKAGEFWKGWQDDEERKTGLVFSTELGEHLGIATVWTQYKKLVEQAGAPSARVHDLRHTFAVNGLQCGDNPKTVQEALGHATAAFTLDVYGHVSERMKEESAKRQQAFIESLTS